MKKSLKEVTKQWNSLKKNKYFPLLCFATGAFFTLIVFQIFALRDTTPDQTFAANQLAIEAEDGKLEGSSAKVVSDAAASNDKYVQLGKEPAPKSTQTPTPTVTPKVKDPTLTPTPTITPPASGNCSISDKLVNSCRPWLGATARNYPQAADNTKDQLLYHEQRLTRQVDMVHTYHPVGTNQLSDTDKFFANRANTYLFANWKPATKWADAGGSNATTNAGIDKMADSIKSLGSKKIFLTIHHEPENDANGGGTCSNYKGSAGSAAQYKAMWKNVRDRFDKKGIKNVVWVMYYMNYKPWNCIVNELYPGDDKVDWIMFNAYGQGAETFQSQVNNMYDFLTKNSNSSHNYSSKPWGISEWSINKSAVAQRIKYFEDVRSVVSKNTYPKLKAYVVFDERDNGSATGEDFRVAYDNDGKYQKSLQDAYNAFAKDPAMMRK